MFGSQAVEVKRYIKTPTGYLMVLRQGDNILEQLESFAKKEKIPSANFMGMGFVKKVKFGFFNAKEKKFDDKDFFDMEIASLTGSIAHQEGKISIHTHAVVGDKTFSTFGGHVLAAEVGTGSAEITIIVHDQKFERKFEKDLGANVLNLGF